MKLPPPQQNPNLSKYSKILQTVLTDEYYNQLTDEYYENGHQLSNKFRPIPYTFLKQQGFDIEPIKADELTCSIAPFIKGEDKNTLYMSVQVENDNNLGNYYSDYVLSYKITDKEYEDLVMLHNGKYLQANLFLQELTNVKTTTINSSVNIDKTTFSKLLDEFNTSSSLFEPVLGKNSVRFDIIDVPDKNHMSILLRTVVPSNTTIAPAAIAYIDYLVYNTSVPTYDNNIFNIEFINSMSFRPINSEEFLKSAQDITYYYPHGLSYLYDFEKTL